MLVDRLAKAARRAIALLHELPTAVVVAGSGEFLARRVAERVSPLESAVVSLAENWDTDRSVAGCAYALIELAVEEDN